MNELSVKEQDLLQRIHEKEELRSLFFQKVKGLKWFDALSERGYFNPENNPKPEAAKEQGFINIPFWQVTNYLVKTASELPAEENQEYAKKFLQILFNVTKYSKEQGFSNYRTWFQFAEIIPHIPSSIIGIEHIDMLDYWLDDQYDNGIIARKVGENWLPSQLKDDDQHSLNLAKEVLRVLYKTVFFDLQKSAGKGHKAAFRFSSYHAREINKQIKKTAGHKLGIDATLIFDRELKRILRKLNNDSWSYLWQPAIEDHDQNKHRDDAENILVEAYRDSLDGFVGTRPNEAYNYVSEMLRDEYQIIHRLAIYTISKNHIYFTKLVDTLLDDKYMDIGYRHEMWHFLKDNYQEFTETQKHKILSLISKIKVSDDEGNFHQVATAYRQASWFKSIKDHGNEEAHQYHANVEITKSEPEHPDFSSYIYPVQEGSESPVPLEELAALSIKELVTKLNEYEDAVSFFEPGIEGLAKEFKQLINTDPLKFSLSLNKFLKLDLAYIYVIIEAYNDLLREKVKLPWDSVWRELLNFCSSVIEQDRFWDAENAKQREAFVANRFWVVGSIGRLLEDGTKSDAHPFSEDYLKKAEEIVSYLLEREEGSEFNKDSNAVYIAINSPRGNCIEALINITLRSCRLADTKNNKDHSSVWSHFQSYYDGELNRADGEKPEYEFATLVSMYLPNFLYMSKEWVLGNLFRIFDQRHYKKWNCAMQGYMHVGEVYKQIYNFLKENGDFLKALDDENLKERVGEGVIQNISIAYIYDFEDLCEDESLITILLQRRKYEELGHLIWSIRNLPADDEEHFKIKVYGLWARILEVVDLDSNQGKKIASMLCLWTTFVDRIDDKTQGLLYPIVPYADEEHNSYILLERIAELSNAQPFEVCAIWMELLKDSRADYPEEAIRQIFSNLVKKGTQGIRKAREVESEYIKRGNERPSIWLKEINDQKTI